MSSAPRPGQTRRQEVIDILCEAYARDEVELEEFERRGEGGHRAQTGAALDALLADISTKAHVPARNGSAGSSAQGSGGGGAAALGTVRPRETVVGVMGGATRRGRWTPARKITAIGIMGGVELD